MSHIKHSASDLPAFNSSEYFAQNILPITTHIEEYTVSTPRHYEHYDDISIIWVSEGAGQMLVLNRESSLCSGTFALLNPLQVFRIIPDSGRSLHYIECHIKTSAFLYLCSGPYFQISPSLLENEDPITVHIPEEEIPVIENLFLELQEEKNKEEFYSKKAELFILMRILSRIFKYYTFYSP